MAITSPQLLTIRLDELRGLRPSWDGSGAKTPTYDALTKARELAGGFDIVPGNNGGVLLTLGLGLVVVAISPGGTVSYPRATTPHREE